MMLIKKSPVEISAAAIAVLFSEIIIDVMKLFDSDERRLGSVTVPGVIILTTSRLTIVPSLGTDSVCSHIATLQPDFISR